MPYITQEARNRLDVRLSDTLPDPVTSGELNYLITRLCLQYLTNVTGISYTGFNEVIGVLECAKQELYQKHVRPYEDLKCLENGEVYP